MDAKFLFDQFPEALMCFVASRDAFLNEEDAKAYAKHFNVEYKTVRKSEIYPDFIEEVSEVFEPQTNIGKAIAKQLADKNEAKVKAIAKAESEAKAQADADAKAEAKAQAEAEAKAQAEADAKAEAEAKAQADADAKAEAEAKAQADAQAAPPATVDVP